MKEKILKSKNNKFCLKKLKKSYFISSEALEYQTQRPLVQNDLKVNKKIY